LLIGKLKFSCGVEFTSNVEGIIGDLFLNRDTNEKFKKWLKEEKQVNNDTILPTNIETSVRLHKYKILVYDIKS
jgi:hypothetical protein